MNRPHYDSYQVYSLLQKTQENMKGKQLNGKSQNLATITYEVRQVHHNFISEHSKLKDHLVLLYYRPQNTYPRPHVLSR